MRLFGMYGERAAAAYTPWHEYGCPLALTHSFPELLGVREHRKGNTKCFLQAFHESLLSLPLWAMSYVKFITLTHTHTHGVGSTFKGFSLFVIDVYSFDHMYCILKMKHFVENPIFGFFLKLRESQRKTKWKRYECRLRDVALGLQIRRWRGLDIWRAVLEEKWKAGLRGIWSQKAQWSNVLTSDGYQQSTRTGKWGRKGRWERGWMPSLLRH